MKCPHCKKEGATLVESIAGTVKYVCEKCNTVFRNKADHYYVDGREI